MNKLERFEENKSFPNLFQPYFSEIVNGFPFKGKWHSDYFKNDNPIVLELGCGKGEYTVGLGQKYPDKNFIGIDQKGARLWRGCKTSCDNKMNNIAFIRMQIELIEYCFDKDEVSEIWITFPEPQPQKAKAKKRFTSPQFNERYSNLLKESGIVHLKTDNTDFYDYSLEVVNNSNHKLLFNTSDLYAEYPDIEVASIQTFYEKMWLEQGLKIKYLQYQLNPEMCKNRKGVITLVSDRKY
ncbi:MAG: tRNA (guanosine(46)-N7)-methyltransferase TrmB [Bacteroidales bacterium]|jgi:tRNA (guanine-N7-)-methyltransferase|nr:tRNA (guanosine(46)-N7)-methyltransferase TrmB [Bacteroidales bacterium]